MTTDEIKQALSCSHGQIQFRGDQEALGKYFKALGECSRILDEYEASKNKEKYFNSQLVKQVEEVIINLKKENDKSAIIDEFISKIESKYLGVHSDELHRSYYPQEIVDAIKEIAEKLKEK